MESNFLNTPSRTSGKKSAWYRFQLPTAVVLMFVAGALMWGNLDERKEAISYRSRIYNINEPILSTDGQANEPILSTDRQANELSLYNVFRQGWPFVFRVRLDWSNTTLPEVKAGEIYDWPPTEEPYPFSLAVTANALIALFILAFTWFGMEVLLLRLAHRKMRPPDSTSDLPDRTESKI